MTLGPVGTDAQPFSVIAAANNRHDLNKFILPILSILSRGRPSAPGTALFNRVLKNTPMCRLFKNVQMQGAQKPKSKAYTRNTSSDEICSATPQASVFQQPV